VEARWLAEDERALPAHRSHCRIVGPASAAGLPHSASQDVVRWRSRCPQHQEGALYEIIVTDGRGKMLASGRVPLEVRVRVNGSGPFQRRVCLGVGLARAPTGSVAGWSRLCPLYARKAGPSARGRPLCTRPEYADSAALKGRSIPFPPARVASRVTFRLQGAQRFPAGAGLPAAPGNLAVSSMLAQCCCADIRRAVPSLWAGSSAYSPLGLRDWFRVSHRARPGRRLRRSPGHAGRSADSQ
jgi:hypothetical protein